MPEKMRPAPQNYICYGKCNDMESTGLDFMLRIVCLYIDALL